MVLIYRLPSMLLYLKPTVFHDFETEFSGQKAYPATRKSLCQYILRKLLVISLRLPFESTKDGSGFSVYARENVRPFGSNTRLSELTYVKLSGDLAPWLMNSGD